MASIALLSVVTAISCRKHKMDDMIAASGHDTEKEKLLIPCMENCPAVASIIVKRVQLLQLRFMNIINN